MSNYETSQPSGVAVFTFGRFNPPTVGHKKMLGKIIEIAEEQHADSYVFVSHTQDRKKNPLYHHEKIKYMKHMFPEMQKIYLSDKVIKTPIDATLYLNKYDRIVMVVGDDRVENFTKMLNRYNGKEMKSGMYNFKSIDIISGGERDPEMEGVSGMSASKMREAAKNEDYITFKQGLPNEYDGSDLLKVVKERLN